MNARQGTPIPDGMTRPAAEQLSPPPTKDLAVYIDGAPYNGEPLIKYEDVQQYVGLSRERLTQLVVQKKIPHYKLGRSVRFRLSEIDKWLSARRMGTTVKK